MARSASFAPWLLVRPRWISVWLVDSLYSLHATAIEPSIRFSAAGIGEMSEMPRPAPASTCGTSEEGDSSARTESRELVCSLHTARTDVDDVPIDGSCGRFLDAAEHTGGISVSKRAVQMNVLSLFSVCQDETILP